MINNTNWLNKLEEQLAIIRAAQKDNFAHASKSALNKALRELAELDPWWRPGVLETLLDRLDAEIVLFLFQSYRSISAHLTPAHVNMLLTKLNADLVSGQEKLQILRLLPLFVRQLRARDLSIIGNFLESKATTEEKEFRNKALTLLLMSMEYGLIYESRRVAFEIYAKLKWNDIDPLVVEKAFKAFATSCFDYEDCRKMACLFSETDRESRILWARCEELASQIKSFAVQTENIHACLSGDSKKGQVLELQGDRSAQNAQNAQNSMSAKKPATLISSALAETNIGKILLAFEEWLEETPLKSSTQRVYISRLRCFVEFVESYIVAMWDESEDDFMKIADAYFSFVKEEYAFKSHSINNVVTMFRLMARASGITNINFDRFACDDAEKTVLTADEIERFVSAARNRNSNRDLLLALIFLKTNIRLGEVINLKVTDLSYEADTAKILIRGRAGRREELLSDDLKPALESWLVERSRSERGSNSEYLFFGAEGDRITGSTLDSALKKIGWQARLNISARLLRNTYLSLSQGSGAGFVRRAEANTVSVYEYRDSRATRSFGVAHS